MIDRVWDDLASVETFYFFAIGDVDCQNTDDSFANGTKKAEGNYSAKGVRSG